MIAMTNDAARPADGRACSAVHHGVPAHRRRRHDACMPMRRWSAPRRRHAAQVLAQINEQNRYASTRAAASRRSSSRRSSACKLLSINFLPNAVYSRRCLRKTSRPRSGRIPLHHLCRSDRGRTVARCRAPEGDITEYKRHGMITASTISARPQWPQHAGDSSRRDQDRHGADSGHHATGTPGHRRAILALSRELTSR